MAEVCWFILYFPIGQFIIWEICVFQWPLYARLGVNRARKLEQCYTASKLANSSDGWQVLVAQWTTTSGLCCIWSFESLSWRQLDFWVFFKPFPRLVSTCFSPWSLGRSWDFLQVLERLRWGHSKRWTSDFDVQAGWRTAKPMQDVNGICSNAVFPCHHYQNMICIYVLNYVFFII